MNKTRAFFTLFLAGWIILLSGNICTLYNVKSNFADRGFFAQKQGVLADVGFSVTESLHNIPAVVKLAELFVTSCCGLCLILMACTLSHQCIAFRNVQLMARLVWIEAWLLAAKGLAQVMTIMPDSNPARPICKDTTLATHGSWIFWRVHYDFCGDSQPISGHLAHLVFAALILDSLIQQRLPHWSCPFRIVAVFILALFSFCIVLIRLHYTVDVILGILLTVCLYTHTGFERIGQRWLQSK